MYVCMYSMYVCLCMGLCAAYDMYVNITDLRNCVSLKFKLLYVCMYYMYISMCAFTIAMEI